MKRSQGVEKRGQITKKRYPIILFATEGENQTEKKYFLNFQTRYGPRLVPADGNDTDPVNMMNRLLKQAGEIELSHEDGDKAYCIIDTDTDKAKQAKIDSACAMQTPLAEVITSSPCFEEWFLCHYRMSTGYLTNAAAIAELRRLCPGYEKNKNIFPQIQEMTSDAVKNAKLLEKHHLQEGRTIQSVNSNPSTEVYKIIEFLGKE